MRPNLAYHSLSTSNVCVGKRRHLRFTQEVSRGVGLSLRLFFLTQGQKGTRLGTCI